MVGDRLAVVADIIRLVRNMRVHQRPARACRRGGGGVGDGEEQRGLVVDEVIQHRLFGHTIAR